MWLLYAGSKKRCNGSFTPLGGKMSATQSRIFSVLQMRENISGMLFPENFSTLESIMYESGNETIGYFSTT